MEKAEGKQTPATKVPERASSKILFVVLLLLFLVSSIYVVIVARSEAVIDIGQWEIPISSFTGVMSSVANFCIILIVVYFNKPGFIIGVILLLAQYPMMISNIFRLHTVTGLPGLFTNAFAILAIWMIYMRNRKIDDFQEAEVKHLTEQQELSQQLFEQTATALVNAIDAKDTYSHGHSIRVAEYSEKIAGLMGKGEEECRQIYYAALLHDVGKIGVDESIINKAGKLTDEEYDEIKRHPIMGDQILAGISEYPYLSLGARYHHERYDGKGYPDGLKGEDIPETARIISVADAYDAMTSNRSYRDAIPQDIVREEIVKGIGTQFDPKAAAIMQHLIDLDSEYEMKEKNMVRELRGKSELRCRKNRDEISDGILVSSFPTKIRLTVKAEEATETEPAGFPSIILFDALDGRYHDEKRTIRELLYYEYCEIRYNGETTVTGARKSQTRAIEKEVGRSRKQDVSHGFPYEIEAVKYRDHVRVAIDDGLMITEVIIALPDSSRFAYIGLTGERCRIGNVSIGKSETEIAEDTIPRIAEEISYIDGIVGDIPNLQVDGYRTAATEGIEVKDGLKISFHTMSLPTARLVWHCAYLDLFYSDDKKVNGEGYREYSLIRLDGETWDSTEDAENELLVQKNDDFENWEVWKRVNKAGFNCTVTFKRLGNKITAITENLGLYIRCTTMIKDGNDKVYVALTGDQCAITDIRIGQ